MPARAFSVEVFILSYNRPEYILEALESVLSQNIAGLKITVSDNSTDDRVQKLLCTHPQKKSFRLLSHHPTLPAIDHFNNIFGQVTTDYVMLFHDDDVLLPGSLSKTIHELNSNEYLSAVGTNAVILDSRGNNTIRFIRSLKSNFFIPDALSLIQQYLDPTRGHVPFPSYLYRSSKIHGLEMNFKEGMKHSDLSFLVKVVSAGPLLWLSEPGMCYRQHENNDSATMDLKAIFSLSRFLKRQPRVDNVTIDEFKMKSIVMWTRQRSRGRGKSLGPNRDEVLKSAAINFLIRNPALTTGALYRKFKNFLSSKLTRPSYK